MAGPAFATWPAWARMKALVIKELLAMLRDKKGRITLVAPPILQLVLFSFASQIVNAYLGQILASANISINSAGQRNQGTPPSEIVPSNAFNPNLEYMWFVLPSLIAMISAITTLSVTAQSVARERELGTFDQLMVTPLRVHEILIGKSIPPFLVGLLNSTIFIVAAVFVFEVPLRGSLVLLYGAIIFYLLSVIGVGLFISSLSKTQQQAFLGTFIFITPAVLLSGYASPIDNIPFWLERISLANPVRHFIVIVQGVFLKAMPLMEVLANTVPLIIISIFTLSAAAWLFRHRME